MKNQQFSTPTHITDSIVMIYAYKYGKIRKRRFYYQRKLVLNCSSHTEKYQCLYFIKIAHLCRCPYVLSLFLSSSICGTLQTIKCMFLCSTLYVCGLRDPVASSLVIYTYIMRVFIQSKVYDIGRTEKQYHQNQWTNEHPKKPNTASAQYICMCIYIFSLYDPIKTYMKITWEHRVHTFFSFVCCHPLWVEEKLVIFSGQKKNRNDNNNNNKKQYVS